MSGCVQRITIPSKSKMLQRVQTRNRIGNAFQGIRYFAYILSHKFDIFHCRRRRTDIQNRDRSKARNMSHETVHSGPNIHMPSWLSLKDLLRNKQILMEVMSPCLPARPPSIGQTRHVDMQWPLLPHRSRHSLELQIVSQKSRQPSGTTNGGSRIEAERPQPLIDRANDVRRASRSPFSHHRRYSFITVVLRFVHGSLRICAISCDSYLGRHFSSTLQSTNVPMTRD